MWIFVDFGLICEDFGSLGEAQAGYFSRFLAGKKQSKFGAEFLTNFFELPGLAGDYRDGC